MRRRRQKMADRTSRIVEHVTCCTYATASYNPTSKCVKAYSKSTMLGDASRASAPPMELEGVVNVTCRLPNGTTRIAERSNAHRNPLAGCFRSLKASTGVCELLQTNVQGNHRQPLHAVPRNAMEDPAWLNSRHPLKLGRDWSKGLWGQTCREI